MDRIRAWWKRLRAMIRPEAADRELTDEMRFHLEMEVAKNLRAGMSPAAALRAARISFGAAEQFKEEVRASRGVDWLETVARDIRHAARSFSRAPGFSAVAVLTLGVGIGAATTVFGVVDAVVLAPLPYPDPDRLVHVWETNPEGGDFPTSEPNYLDFRDRNRTFSALAAYRPGGGGLTLTGIGEPRLVKVASGTASLFRVLGVDALVGRTFSDAEDVRGGNPVVLLSHGFWQRTFGGDSTLVGRTITLAGTPYTVVGVLPASFRFLPVEAWVPLAPSPTSERDDHWLGMVGRLGPARTVSQAQADLGTIAAANGAIHPVTKGWGVRVAPLEEWVVTRPFRQSSVLLMGAVSMLLLLACANIATLLLARATARQTDLRLRLALGAGAGRLARQQLTESGLLATVGSVLGLALAGGAVALIRGLPARVPRLETVAVNGRVMVFAIVATVVVTLVVGLFPALQAGRTDLHSALKRAGRAGTPAGSTRLREALVVVQVALAVMLLIGGGLMIRSAVRLERTDTGLATDHVWTVPLQLAAVPEEWKVARFFDRVAERIKAIPGVSHAGATIIDPYTGADLRNDVTPEERATEAGATGYLQAAWRIVSPGYFEAAGVPIIKGRDFGDVDRADGVPVAIVSRTLADRLWPGQDPLGRRLYWGGVDGDPRTIIGVVGDIRDVTIGADPPPMVFFSTRQLAWPAMTVVVRANRAVPDLADRIREAIWAEDPSLPIPTIRAMKDSRAGVTAGPRITALTLGIFGGASLLLAGIGLYGVLAFAVVERTREIGLRMALGARPAGVVSAIVRRGVLLALLGIAIGVTAAAALTGLMGSLLYRTERIDPLTYLLAPLTLGMVTLAAAYLPARRATRIDPMAALRSD